MDFVSGVTWRPSQRGLVVCGPGGSSLLVEHPRATDLPALLDGASSADELSALLGGSDADRQVVDDLIAERILTDPAATSEESRTEREKRVVFTRSGVEFTGNRRRRPGGAPDRHAGGGVMAGPSRDRSAHRRGSGRFSSSAVPRARKSAPTPGSTPRSE
jgi:hypothetical protein